MESFVKFQIIDNIGQILLDNPEKKNAISPEMIKDIIKHIDSVEDNPQIRCILIASSNNKIFSSGYDISSIKEDYNDESGVTSLPIEEQELLDKCAGEVMLFRLRGPLSFGAAKGISDRMGLIRNYKVLILDITDVPRLGVTATLAIEQMIQEVEA